MRNEYIIILNSEIIGKMAQNVKAFDTINLVIQIDKKLPNISSSIPVFGNYITVLVVASFNILVTKAYKGNFTNFPSKKVE